MIRVEQVTVKMDKPFKYCINIVLIFFVFSLFACGDEQPPAPPPQAISKKIPTDAPSKTAPATEKPAAAAGKAGAAAVPASGDVAPEAQTAPAQPSAESELIKATMEIAGTYDPKGRIDPFEPLFKERPEQPQIEAEQGTPGKRKPQTPLERIALSQIKLSAIMRSTSGNRALVEDATGKGYVIKQGTYIGLNSGRVIQIEKDRVVIEEEIENLMGELIVQNTELKLQKPAGEI